MLLTHLKQLVVYNESTQNNQNVSVFETFTRVDKEFSYLRPLQATRIFEKLENEDG